MSHGRQTFLLDLLKPLLCHGLKCIGGGDGFGDLVQLRLFERIVTFGELPTRLEWHLARIAQQNLRPPPNDNVRCCPLKR